ncbi:MAG: hypothetical protein NUV84_00565 [Candidatus Uhrbacteria bacterium]|nr:hypothetical protein [Candidatus Uhrbacteria bacterium]
MSIESRRSSERVRGRLREGDRERRGRDRRIDVTPVADRGSATPDTATIEAARVRALAAAGVAATEEEQQEDRPLFNFATRTKKAVVGVGKGGLQFMGGSLVAFTYLGYQASRPVLFTVAHALDWIGQRMNKLGDKLIDKKLPILNWFINPLVSLIDKASKSLGIDKTLAEHLKKHREDRKKLADKVFKDYMATLTKAEKKVDDAAAKAKRRKVIEEKFGKEVADAIGDDVDAAAAAAPKAESAPAAAPAAEAPKAA